MEPPSKGMGSAKHRAEDQRFKVLPELSKVAEVMGYGCFVTDICMAILDGSDF
jgi:hypothetical protein